MKKTFDNQVLTIEQCNHLRKLGWADFPRYTDKTGIGLIIPTEYTCKRFKPSGAMHYLTLTTADIMEVLPETIPHTEYYLNIQKEDKNRYVASYIYHGEYEEEVKYEALGTLIDALYDTLVWCIENGYVEVKGGNE